MTAPLLARLAVLAALLGALAACGASGSAHGGASDDGARGRIQLGLPF